MNYFVTAIGTDSGKTVFSAILCEALGYDYWKPIQAGLPTDAETVAALVQNPHTNLHKERYLLKTPASPHAAAKLEGLRLQLSDFHLPTSESIVVIEGAGGCLVPLNDSDFVIDLATHFNSSVILVANIYLGSINHTLLTVNLLKQKSVNVKGIVFNGPPNDESERIILLHSGYPCLLRMRPEPRIDKTIVKKYANSLKSAWNE